MRTRASPILRRILASFARKLFFESPWFGAILMNPVQENESVGTLASK